jgi:5'-nucleotidase
MAAGAECKQVPPVSSKQPDVAGNHHPVKHANMRLVLAVLACLLPALAGCAAATGARQPLDRAAGTEVQILAMNDFHGNLEPPGIAIPAHGPDGSQVEVPAGGAVYLASARQLKALLEQQFASGTNTPAQPKFLLPSEGFEFTYDLARAAGQRVVAMRLGGRPIDPAQRYRVATNTFLATGGDNFTVFVQGGETVSVGLDLDALEGHLARGAAVPQLGRIRNAGR